MTVGAPMPESLERKLQAAGQRVRTANEKTAELTARRDALIRDAVSAGISVRKVGAAVGLSHVMCKYIARGRAAR